MFAAENVKGQKAPFAIVNVKSTALPLPVDPVIGRGEVQDQLARNLFETLDEQLHQSLRHGQHRGAVRAVLQGAQRRAAGQLRREQLT
jgi:hypothetical protein